MVALAEVCLSVYDVKCKGPLKRGNIETNFAYPRLLPEESTVQRTCESFIAGISVFRGLHYCTSHTL